MAAIRRARYRIWQFWHAIRPVSFPPEHEAAVLSILNTQELILFQRQPLPYKNHCYRVMRILEDSGQKDRDLLAAALLHDIGKTKMKMAWWDRPLVVLTEAFVPSLAKQWARRTGRGWSRPFVIKARHAEWGAEEASASGSSELTVELIRYHHEISIHPEETSPDHKDAAPNNDPARMLALLQWADSIN
jgi:putative nucleotidyltransferase with HDIG domain